MCTEREVEIEEIECFALEQFQRISAGEDYVSEGVTGNDVFRACLLKEYFHPYFTFYLSYEMVFAPILKIL